MFRVALILVQLTGPDGQQRIDINPNEVTSLREPRHSATQHFAKGTHCIISMVNGYFIYVQEDCETVRQRVGPEQNPCVLMCEDRS